MKQYWRSININKKLNTVWAVMVGLIVFQLTIMIFSVGLFKTVRVLTSGETKWSKVQKKAVYSLSNYVLRGEEKYYLEFEKSSKLQASDRLGRLEVQKKNTDHELAARYFASGANKNEDVLIATYVTSFLVRFPSFAKIMEEWEDGDVAYAKLNQIAEQVYKDYSAGVIYTNEEKNKLLDDIYAYDETITAKASSFSDELGRSARQLENTLAVVFLALMVTVSVIGVSIAISLIRSFRRSLYAIKKSIKEAVSGNFNAQVALDPSVDIENISLDLQEMFTSFKVQMSGRMNAEEGEARLAVLGDAMPQMVCIKKPGSNEVEFLNKKVWEYFGIEHRNPKEVNIYAYCHPNDYEPARIEYELSIKEKRTSVSEIRLKGKDGKYKWFLSRFEPAINANGEIYRWYGSYTDIEEQKNNSLELEKAVVIRDQFLSIASHELKTPLTSFKLQLEIRKRILSKQAYEKLSPEYFDKMIKDDEKQINRLVRLVDDMLDISRIRLGKMELNKKEFEFNELLIDIVERFYPEFKAKNCELKFYQKEKMVGIWDRYKIEQVIVNLLTNALKYGRNRDVEIGLIQKDEKKICFYVKDQGVGIKAEDCAKIFDLFERVNTDHAIAGLGLGLYIVKQIVEAHEGTIYVESEIEQGSTFFMELPL